MDLDGLGSDPGRTTPITMTSTMTSSSSRSLTTDLVTVLRTPSLSGGLQENQVGLCVSATTIPCTWSGAITQFTVFILSGGGVYRINTVRKTQFYVKKKKCPRVPKIQVVAGALKLFAKEQLKEKQRHQTIQNTSLPGPLALTQ